MRFFKTFRLLHRRTKSESDMSHMVSSRDPASPTTSSCLAEVSQIKNTKHSSSSISGSTAPVFVSFESSIPSFNPAQLYQPRSAHYLDGVTSNSPIYQPDSDVFGLRQANTELAADLADVTNDLSRTRSELYMEMTKLARFQHQVSRGMDHIQKLEARFQRLAGLLVDIGIPYFTVQRISDALDSGIENADHMLVDAIGDAIHDPEALLSNLKPAVIGQRVPEHYQSALQMTLSVRRKVRIQKKVSKFWKHIAQEDGRHADTVTPSSSDLSSIREPLTPARQYAVNALIARRREANAGSVAHVSDPPSAQAGSVLSASGSGVVSAVTCSASGSIVQSHHADTTPPSRARFSISELRISHRRSNSAVLGNIDLNVFRSPTESPEGETEPGDPQEDEFEEQNARPMVTLSQDLIQNLNRVALGRGPHYNSTASRSSVSTRVSSSAFSSLNASHKPTTARDLDLSSDTPFDNSTFHSLLYGTDNARTDSDRKCSNARSNNNRNSRFLEHINEYSIGSLAVLGSVDSLGFMNSSGSLAVLDTTTSTATSPGLFGLSGESKDSLFMSTQTPTTGPTTPSKTPPTGSSTPSSTGSKLPVLRHLRTPVGFGGGIVRRLSPSPESFVRKLRSLGSREGNENVSPEKPSGIPIMQRRMTIKGRVVK